MNTMLDTKLAIKVDEYIDQEHAEMAKLGELFFRTFKYERSGRISAQVRNLQQIVCSATRFADIEDVVKNQMGKTGSAAKLWREVGKETLKALKQLREQSEKPEVPEKQRLAFRLKLARGWVRAVVSDYLYRIAEEQIEENP